MAPKRQRDKGDESGDSDASSFAGGTPKQLKFNPSSKPIKVTVGSGLEVKDFYIHEDILKRHSEFCSAALSQDWREAREGAITLPEEKPEIFGIFASFVYASYVDVPKQKDTDPNFSGELVCLLDCWILADMLISQSFKDAVVDALVGRAARTKRVPLGMAQSIHARSSLPCGIKRLLVDFAVYEWAEKDFSQIRPTVEQCVFFMETTMRARNVDFKKGRNSLPWVDAGCKYHDHGKEGQCYKTMF